LLKPSELLLLKELMYTNAVCLLFYTIVVVTEDLM